MKRMGVFASAGAITLLVAVAAGSAIADSDTSPDGTAWPQSIDSSDPSPTTPPTPFVPEPGTLGDQLAAAKLALESAAEHPNTIVCLTSQGTLAGTIEADRPVSAPPFTTAQRKLACDQEWPGSHP